MRKIPHPAGLLVGGILACGWLNPPVTCAQGLQVPQAIGDVAVTVRPADVPRGASFEVVVQFQVQPGLHIQANQPTYDWLIGTALTPAETPGLRFGQPLFPEAHSRTDPALGQMLEYTGDVTIRLAGVVEESAEPGPRQIDLKLRYQACNDKGTCFPPQTLPLKATLTILSGDPVAQAQIEEPAAGAAAAARDDGKPAAAAARPRPKAHLPWQPFSSQKLEELTAAGKTVLIDFTADWCPNCKLNEFWALNTQETAELVAELDVVPLLADFTEQDDQILAWLRKFNSISVPLTVIVPGSNPAEPILLRDTYRQSTLLAALREAGPSVEPAEAGTGLTLETVITLNEQDGSIWWYLLAGLVGGFVLNFMPCVLPVISIKVLSLVSQAGQSPGKVFGLGLAFAAGMIALFLVLGLSVAGMGELIGLGTTWGAWFQSTTFLLIMLGVLVAMAASLFGAFTLAVPGVVGDADAAIEGEGYVGSFGKGVLAVLLGTPCSGPLLGTVLAWAAAKSAAGQAHLALLVFAAMGVGMAFPFVILAARPGWMRFIPRPGPWMETFKQLMGFLLLLTTVYILWLLRDAAVAAVLYALGVAFAAWLYGRLVAPDHSPATNWFGRAVSAGVVAGFVWLSFFALPALAPEVVEASSVSAAAVTAGEATTTQPAAAAPADAPVGVQPEPVAAKVAGP